MEVEEHEQQQLPRSSVLYLEIATVGAKGALLSTVLQVSFTISSLEAHLSSGKISNKKLHTRLAVPCK